MQTRLYGIIYRATSPSGKHYIGQTVRLMKYRRHAHEEPTGKRVCRALYAAICKYGKDKMRWEVIASAWDAAGLNYAETALIHQHNSLAPNGYNLTTGGDSRKESEEVRRNKSLARLGYVPSAETRAKIGAANKGKKRTPETCARTKAALARPDVIAKLVAKRRANWHNNHARKAAHIATMKTYWADPARRAARRAGMQALWRDPVYRENITAARKKARELKILGKSAV